MLKKEKVKWLDNFFLCDIFPIDFVNFEGFYCIRMLIISKDPQFDDRKQPYLGQCNLDTDGWELEYYDRITSLRHVVFKGYYFDCREIQLACANKEFLEISDYITKFTLLISKEEHKSSDWLPHSSEFDSVTWVLTYINNGEDPQKVFEGFYHDCREIQASCLGKSLDEVLEHVEEYKINANLTTDKSDDTVVKKLFKFL